MKEWQSRLFETVELQEDNIAKTTMWLAREADIVRLFAKKNLQGEDDLFPEQIERIIAACDRWELDHGIVDGVIRDVPEQLNSGE